MLPYSKHFITFATAIGKQGTLTEWLGSGLQNRARQFDSARYLKPIRCKTLESSTLQRMFFSVRSTFERFTNVQPPIP